MDTIEKEVKEFLATLIGCDIPPSCLYNAFNLSLTVEQINAFEERFDVELPWRQSTNISGPQPHVVGEFLNVVNGIMTTPHIEIAVKEKEKKIKRRTPSRNVISSLISERDSISERLRRIREYAVSVEYNALSDKHQSIVRQQITAMEEYRNSIVKRIGEGLCTAYLAKGEKQNKEEEQA